MSNSPKRSNDRYVNTSTPRKSKGDERVRFDRIAARFRRERSDFDLDECWVAFRRSTNERDPRRRGDRVVLDLEHRNGAMFIGHRQALIVDERTAVSAPGSGSEYRKIWAMIEEGHPTWTTDPLRVEQGTLDGRPIETLRWEHPEGSAAISYDVRTGMCVASTTPTEMIELTDLRFDSDVLDEWFEEPPGLDGWTGARRS